MTETHFSLFDLEPQYNIDKQSLRQRFLKLQKALHPDRHSAGTEAEKFAAASNSAHINRAMEVLSDDTQRAEYLLGLTDAETSPPNNPAMLERQMELREQLAEFGEDESRIQTFIVERKKEFAALGEKFAVLYNRQNYAEAAAAAQEMKFVDKIIRQAQA